MSDTKTLECLPAPGGCEPVSTCKDCGAVASYNNERGRLVSNTRTPDPGCGCGCHGAYRLVFGPGVKP